MKVTCLVVLMLCCVVQADTIQHFDVTMGLGHKDNLHYILPGSWGASTGDWVVDDWYSGCGKPSPYSGDLFDVEAMYFDYQNDNVYLAVVTSFPFTGFLYGADKITAGDLSFEVSGTRYGVNLNNEVRGNTASGGTLLGSGFYKTLPTDWFLGNPHWTPPEYKSEVSNFDPSWSGFGGTYIGNVSTYYSSYNFSGGDQEQNLPTYVIGVTIPTKMFEVDWNKGGDVNVSWMPGCSNDRLKATFDNPTPELGSWVLLSLGLGVIAIGRKRNKSSPLV